MGRALDCEADIASNEAASSNVQASFTAMFGAPGYLVERVDDLRMVLSFDEASGQRVSLADAASNGFDLAVWIDDGQFARFVTIESAEGGRSTSSRVMSPINPNSCSNAPRG